MSYVRFEAPADSENPVKTICAKLREAGAAFSRVKLDETAPALAVVKTNDASAVKQVFGLQP